MSELLDLAIIGGGPAGLSAGLYATRGGLANVTMFELGMPGGQITSSSEIENYPGVAEVVSGLDFMQSWTPQATRFGLKVEMDEIVRVSRDGELFIISSALGNNYKAKSVIVATGSKPKKAGFNGELEFFGRGVSVCATCDGFFYKGKEVIVLGGGDSAVEEAHYLSKICKKVYLVHRSDRFKAAPNSVERVQHTQNIEIITNATVERVFGDVSGVLGAELLIDGTTKRTIDAPGLFTFVGREINNAVLAQEDGSWLCDMSGRGEIVVDLRMKTSAKGLFAAGDVRIEAARQVVCAAADGAVAALEAIAYVDRFDEKTKATK